MKTYKVDLHGLTVIESQIELTHILNSLGWDYGELLVVHGYHSHILLDYVRKEFKHNRIKQMVFSLNPGDTTFILKTKEEYEKGLVNPKPVERKYFLKDGKIGFSIWSKKDFSLYKQILKNSEISQFISDTGAFSNEEIKARFNQELANQEKYHCQHWPIFDIEKKLFIGYCGFSDNKGNTRNYPLEICVMPQYWNLGYGQLAVKLICEYAFEKLDANSIVAIFHPNNKVVKKVLEKTGFKVDGEKYNDINGYYYLIYKFD